MKKEIAEVMLEVAKAKRRWLDGDYPISGLSLADRDQQIGMLGTEIKVLEEIINPVEIKYP
jgi:hypothetical protein